MHWVKQDKSLDIQEEATEISQTGERTPKQWISVQYYSYSTNSQQQSPPHSITERTPQLRRSPMRKRLATMGKKNSLLTERDVQQNQDPGEAGSHVIWIYHIYYIKL